MAGGGLFILVAYGSQNVILSGNPDFTYFYMILKKYSHFAFESATLPLEGPQELFFDEPIQLRAKIQRIGDLLSDLYFTFTLPDIYSKYFNPNLPGSRNGRSQYQFQWVRYIGAQIIQNATFLIGGTQVQEFDSDYIISTAFTDQDETQYNKWQQLVGDIPEIYDPANGKYSGVSSGAPLTRARGLYPSVYQNQDPAIQAQSNFPSIPGRDITIPLSFWFSQNAGLALPLISLQFHECEVQLTLRPIRDLYTILDPAGYRVRPETKVNATSGQLQSGNVSYTSDNDPGIYINQFLTDIGYTVPALNTWPLNPRLQATYIYLTDDERRTFATKPLNYIVRQVTNYKFENISSRQLFDLYTHNPVPRLIIIPRRTDYLKNLNAWTNFTNWWLYPSAPFIPAYSSVPVGGYSGILQAGLQQDIIHNLRIVCDGNEIQELKPLQYFNEVSSWKYASGVFPPGLAIYSFALDTSKWIKPSGSLNTSRVKNFQLDVDPWPLVAGSLFAYNFSVYVESINFLVIEGGMGGMKYAT
uniref:Major capsid protein N-terminal domain-containing protein n=1 Tax=viral metagenome TaxID=1070528 RepID=A0A6C0AMK7_9ZZZZ